MTAFFKALFTIGMVAGAETFWQLIGSKMYEDYLITQGMSYDASTIYVGHVLLLGATSIVITIGFWVLSRSRRQHYV